jgi:hypothetical protein
VSTLRAVTVAPATTACRSSITVPPIVPVLDWAETSPKPLNINSEKNKILKDLFIFSSCWVLIA